MASYFTALTTVLQPMNLLMLFVCSILGVILGAIPGLSGGLGMTLILPLTFALNTELSFCMLLGMYIGGMSGAFIAAVLVGIPGTPAAICTCYDGYPMTQQGKASKALTIGLTASFMGTAISVIVATLLSGPIANIALMLGPWEYFSLCFMAISVVVGMAHGSIYKSLMGAFLGLFLSCIGTERVSNAMRYTFRNYNLFGGVPVIALLMGVFAVHMIATNFARGNQEMPDVDSQNLKGFGLTLKDFTDNAKTIFRSLMMGLWIGFLPGMGGGIASMLSYGQAKKGSKRSAEFGKGCEEGLWASEVANNAGLGGAIIPMISLGIPGDGSTVLLLSAMTIHGLQAGPMFIRQNPVLANLIFAAMLVAGILVFVSELLTKRWFPKLLKAPYHYLYSAILVICFVGSYSSTTSMFSVGAAIFFGALAVLLEIAEIPSGPMMLSYILGGNLEYYFRNACSYAQGSYAPFFTRPVSCILLLIGIYMLFSPLVKHLIDKRKAAKSA